MSNVELYLLSLEPIKKMFFDGLITDKEYLKSEAFLANKYCIKKFSLYRANDLINSPFRVMYISEKKEVKHIEESRTNKTTSNFGKA